MARLNAKWYNFNKRGQAWDHFWQDAAAASAPSAVVLAQPVVTNFAQFVGSLDFNITTTAGNYLAIGNQAALGNVTNVEIVGVGNFTSGTPVSNGGRESSAWYYENCPGGALVVRVTYSVGFAIAGGILAEYQGVPTSATFNTEATGSSTSSTSVTSSAFTTTQDNILAIVFSDVEDAGDSAWVLPSGFAQKGLLYYNNNPTTPYSDALMIMGDKIYSSIQTAQTLTSSGATSNSRRTCALFINIPAPSGGSTSPVKAFDYITSYSTAILKGKGNFKGNHSIDISAAAILKGKGNFKGIHNIDISAAAILNGKGNIKANDAISNYSTAILKGKGNFKANHYIDISAAAILNGKGNLKGNHSIDISVAAILNGKGNVKGNHSIDISAAAILNGKGNIKATDLLYSYSSALLNGKGILQARDSIIIYTTGRLSSGLTLKARDYIETYSSAVLKGKGSLNATDRLLNISNAILKGRGTLTANHYIDISAAAILNGKGNIKAFENIMIQTLAGLKGKGALNATDYLLIVSTATLVNGELVYAGTLYKCVNGVLQLADLPDIYNNKDVSGQKLYLAKDGALGLIHTISW